MSFAAFFMAVFMIGSINQSVVTPEKSKANEPTVTDTSPSDGEEDVARNVVFEITFSESMESATQHNARESATDRNDRESATDRNDRELATDRNDRELTTDRNDRESTNDHNASFTLKQGNETVEGTFEYSGNKGIFTAEKPLKANTKYTASLSMQNNHMQNNHMDRNQSDRNQSDNDYSNNEFNDDENARNSDNYSANNDNEWTFTTGGNSEPVETVDLGSAANYVILAQTSIQNDTSSEITGERGFDPEFKSSNNKDDKTAYWLNNEDIDKDEVRREKEEAKEETEEGRRDANREMSDRHDSATNERDSNSENLDQALEDMISAYTDAAERTPVDFVDYKFHKSDDQSESVWNNDRDDQNEMNTTETRWEDNDQDDSEEEYNVDYNEDHNDDYMTESEMNQNRSESNMNRDTNDTSVTLEPGIYKWNESVELSSNITLSGNADDVWIFQISEGLTVNRDVEITLGSGVVPENVIWQVAGEVNIGEASHFEGIILSQTGITMKNGASLNGRMLAQTNITLDENTIMEPQVFASVQRSSIDE